MVHSVIFFLTMFAQSMSRFLRGSPAFFWIPGTLLSFLIRMTLARQSSFRMPSPSSHLP